MASLNQRKGTKDVPWALTLAFALSTAIPLLGASAQDVEDEVTLANLEEKIELAQTADDHRALATFYSGQATEAQNKASKHENMAQMYKSRTSKVIRSANSLIKHCNKLAADYQSLADGLLAMAKEHELMASEIE